MLSVIKSLNISIIASINSMSSIFAVNHQKKNIEHLTHFFKGAFWGIICFFQSFRFIYQNNLIKYWFFPLLLGVLFYSTGYYLKLQWEADIWEPLNGNFLEKGIQWTFQTLKKVTIDLFLVFNGYITLILMSPIFTHLSAKTEFIINGKKYPAGIVQILKDIWRAIIIALKNGISHLILIIIYYLISSFFPVLAVWQSEILIVLGFYFYGYSFLDYTLERKKMNVKNSIQFVRRNAGLAFTLGLCFSLVFYIPIIGPTFGGVAATIASVLSLNKLAVLGKL